MKRKTISAVCLLLALWLFAGCSFDNYIVPGTDRRGPKTTGEDIREANAADPRETESDVILPPVEYDDSLGDLTAPPEIKQSSEDASLNNTAEQKPEDSIDQGNTEGLNSENNLTGVSSEIQAPENVKPELKLVHAAPESFDKSSVKSFVSAGDDWFKDALFIGDSRFVGLMYYGNIEGAYWYCNTGLSVFNINNAPLDVEGIGSIVFSDLISLNQFSKIYICLGINECGYGTSAIKSEFGKLIDTVKRTQPNAPIFLEANIHLAAARSDTDSTYNNKKLNAINEAIASYADNIQTFYVNVNEIFDDERGYLKKDYTADSTHIFAKYYPQWTQFLKEHAIQ
ncbi:MAG: hypothetical protein IJM08_06215 [Firmicutes bacterium]|nr:hypothetical protein [Bacillota bacterium]